MPYNYMRGRQMIIHDPRLNNPYTTPPTVLKPPDAMNVWTVTNQDTAEHILDHAAKVAGGSTGTDKLDALHFMSHGYPGGIEIGKDNMGLHNFQLFDKLAGRIKGAIVFFGCTVGAEQTYHSSNYQLTFGYAVCMKANCRVFACKLNQVYSWNPATRVLDFGDFEGLVYLFTPDQPVQLHNITDYSKLNLEPMIFR